MEEKHYVQKKKNQTIQIKNWNYEQLNLQTRNGQHEPEDHGNKWKYWLTLLKYIILVVIQIAKNVSENGN